MEVFKSWLENDFFKSGFVLGASLFVGIVLYFVFMIALKRVAKKTKTILDDAIVRHCRGPLLISFILLTVHLGMPLTAFSDVAGEVLRRIFGIMLITSIAWLIIRFTRVFQDLVQDRFDVKVSDNLRARKVHTKYNILSKIVIAITVLLALASVLMTFDSVRRLGTGLLASAGIVGVIAGFAAQRSLATLVAGIQVALTQPIRIDDVVIVEGEWGRIEEISLTYVVVKIWDQRRLIVPINYFLETPFQNWTRVSAEILGTVLLRVDPTVPVEELRAEVIRICKQDKRWDGRVAGLVMTDAGERSVELRALVSAEDASKAWDLRCDLREKLVDYIKNNYPWAIPRLRAEVTPAEVFTGTPVSSSPRPDVKPVGQTAT